MKVRYLKTLGAAMVVGAALMAAPATVAGKADEKTPIYDLWLTSKSKIALFADARVKGRQIDVETQKGRVIIRGKVDSDVAKIAAEEIARGIDGVKGVKNELQVVDPYKTRGGGGRG